MSISIRTRVSSIAVFFIVAGAATAALASLCNLTAAGVLFGLAMLIEFTAAFAIALIWAGGVTLT